MDSAMLTNFTSDVDRTFTFQYHTADLTLQVGTLCEEADLIFRHLRQKFYLTLLQVLIWKFRAERLGLSPGQDRNNEAAQNLLFKTLYTIIFQLLAAAEQAEFQDWHFLSALSRH